MKIVQPSVELLGLMLPVEMQESGIILKSFIPEALIERAGRVCYKSENNITPESYKSFVEKVCKNYGHESIMEHSGLSVLIITDRGVANEIVRHRIGSFAQESTRYCNYGKDKFDRQISVIAPEEIRSNLEYCNIWMESMRVAEKTYLDLLDHGVKPEIARSVLPLSLKTEIVVTFNFREWKHFIDLRTSAAAHPQMRQVAGMCQDILRTVAPVIFE